MKKVQEIDRSTLTIEQKLGMLICTTLAYGEEDVEYALDLVTSTPSVPFGYSRASTRMRPRSVPAFWRWPITRSS